ncbi:MAG: ABC transporter permease, partial [Lutimonas sp.]
MKKLMLIIQREFLAKVRNRSFIVMTFLSPLVMIGMILLVAFLSKSSLEKRSVVAYVDESELFTEEDFAGKSIDFMDLSEVGIEKAKIIVMEADQDGLLYIPQRDSLDQLAASIQFFSKETPGMVLIGDLENTIERKLEKQKMEQLGIDLEKLDQANINVDISMSNFTGERSSKMINGIKVAMGMGAGYLIMMFIIIYGAMVMRSVIEEKTSRIVEVIISSVKPFQLMLGKVLGTAGAGLLQFLIWAVILIVLFFGLSFFFGVDLGGMNQAQMTAEQ